MFDIHCHFVDTAKANLGPVRKRGNGILANREHAQTSCCATVLVFIFWKPDEQVEVV